MTQLRVALAQMNPTVGDLDGNAGAALDWSRRAADAGADLVAFPEMALTGYPVEDLALRSSFVAAARERPERLAAELDRRGLGELVVVVGYLDCLDDAQPATGRPAGAPRNAVAVLHGGNVIARSAKHHLPNYGVFDEYRYFVPGESMPVVRVRGVDVGVVVCEDLWQDGGPVAVAAQAGVGLLLTVNASPYERNKDDVRLELVRRRAGEAGAALAYVNMVGGQDELVFDGDSIVVDASGDVLARGYQFDEELLVADMELPAARAGAPSTGPYDAGDGSRIRVEHAVASAEPAPARSPAPQLIADRLDDLAEIYAALVTGTRDYVRKNGFSSVVLALSGGIDSALTATIAMDALGASRVHAVLLPSRHSTEHSVTDAEDLVKRQGTEARTVPIADIVAAFESAVELTGIAAENLQARVRGTLVMGVSNEQGHLVLATGNKSELAVGYSTLYGDAVGGFAPIKDVLKTTVWDLARWRNEQASRRGEQLPIPEHSITKPPSAELRPGQLDVDTLPDYAVLDPLLADYVEHDRGREQLRAAGHDAELVDRVIHMVDRAEYKRRQYPPGPKITPKNFGRDRRLPITNAWRDG